MITEDYVSFETAKLLKEKGFDEICRAFWKEWNGEISLYDCNSSHTFDYCHNTMLENYNDSEETNIAAPTLQIVMKWLREVHNLAINVCYLIGIWYYSIYKTDAGSSWFNSEDFDTYEQACEAAIKYCLENLI